MNGARGRRSGCANTAFLVRGCKHGHSVGTARSDTTSSKCSEGSLTGNALCPVPSYQRASPLLSHTHFLASCLRVPPQRWQENTHSHRYYPPRSSLGLALSTEPPDEPISSQRPAENRHCCWKRSKAFTVPALWRSCWFHSSSELGSKNVTKPHRVCPEVLGMGEGKPLL